MRKLVPKRRVVQVVLDALVDHRSLEQRVNGGTLPRALLQAHLDDVLQTVRVIASDVGVPALCGVLQGLLNVGDGPR